MVGWSLFGFEVGSICLLGCVLIFLDGFFWVAEVFLAFLVLLALEQIVDLHNMVDECLPANILMLLQEKVVVLALNDHFM